MCNLGGIALIKRKGKWEVKEWENGKAPEHDHFFLEPRYVDEHNYPVLEKFIDGSGILIGASFKISEGGRSGLPVFFLDGIVLSEKG
jgi:hypothetical protein